MVQQPQENAVTTTLIGTSRMLTVPSLSAHLKCQTPRLESRPKSAPAVKGGVKKEWSSQTTPTSHTGPTIYVSHGKYHSYIYWSNGFLWRRINTPLHLFLNSTKSIFTDIFSDVLQFFEWPLSKKDIVTTGWPSQTLRQNRDRTAIHPKLQNHCII